MASVDKTIRIYLKMHNELSKEAEKATNSLKKMGDNISSIGNKMTAGITLPLVGMGVAMMKTFADFESVMTEIGARTGATAEEMKKMSDFAIKMGRDTKFSATEAAQALLELTSSGQSAAQAMETLPAVLNLAAAGAIDLGRAADGVTDILAQFRLSVKDSASVADILTKAAGSSSATIESLIQGFNNVGPVAKAFNISVADTAAALAVLHENGIKGAESGTALKSMLLNMSRNTESAKEAWRTLGISMYDAQGNMKNIDDLFKEINVAMKDMSMKEQNQITQDLAGTYGLLAFNSLRVANGTSEMRNQMHAAAGAEEVASEMSKTLMGRWEQLMGSIETLAIVLGQLAAGPLSDFLGWLTDCINAFSSWAEANPVMAQTVLILLGIVAALGPILSMIGGIMSGLAAIGPVIASLGAIIGFILSPIGILIAAVLFLFAVWQNWFGIRDILWVAVKGIVDAFMWLFDIIGKVGNVLAQTGQVILQGWGNILSRFGETISGLGNLIWTMIVKLGERMFGLGQGIIDGLLNGIKSKAVDLLAYVFGLSKEMTAMIKNALGIHSPSKVMMDIGKNVVAGFHKGIENMGGIGVNVPQAGGSIQSRQPSLAVAGASSGGGSGNGGVYIENLIVPPGTTQEQIKFIMKEIGKEAARKGAKPTR